MKNFSAKNAEFETLKINNEAAITSANLGTDPNKIPLNKDLGSLAYQDAVNLDDVSADMLELRAIAAEISDSAVDVFVYDTSRDSDGGAWRKRTQHTSWYNEELNTATRGARREFPAVAVIVAEGGATTIYDGDDPDMGMWMVFNADVAGKLLNTIGGNTSLAALNGDIFVGCNENVNGGVSIKIAFISDTSFAYANNQITQWPTGISGRDTTVNYTIFLHSYGLVSLYVNDVAMTILPNAPIDENTGLPVPTIAVATDGGVSVIKHDGTVVDITCGNISFTYSYYVIFDQLNRLFFSLDGQGNSRRMWGLNDIPATDLVVTTDINEKQNADIFIADDNSYGTATKDMFLFNQSNPQTTGLTPDSSIGTNKGLFKAFINREDSSKSLHNYTTSKYNTGWMPGDIKLATLSDTTVENIGVNSDELVTNAGFLTDSDWTKGTGWTISGNSALHKAGTDGGDIDQSVSLLVGQAYTIIVNITTSDFSEFYFKLDDGNYIQIEGSPLGVHSYTFIASESIQNVGARGGVNWDGEVDNISVRATTELITNGDFSTDSDWNKSDHWTISNENAIMNSTSQYKPLYQYDLNMITGKKYVATIDVSVITGEIKFDTARINGEGISEGDGIIISSTGIHSLTFVAESDQDGIGVARRSSPASCTINSISVRPAVDDRSVNNNGLQVIGGINKTKVAPGADLVAYSGFSANNYLVQPYNEDLNFGTGDFCFLFWVKAPTSSQHETIFEGGYDYSLSAYSGNCFHFFITQGGPIAFSISNTAFQSLDQFIGSRNIRNNTWSQVAVRRVGDIFEYYINGQFDSSHTFINSDGTIDFENSKLTVGCRPNNSLPMDNGSLSSLRISATAPTAEQIAKIYRDEKALFQDGAQATLYGTSDSVTALAYDDSEQLLHVGTASGRSDFRGLARVNNTTTAISNSISAAEGTIIQN